MMKFIQMNNRVKNNIYVVTYICVYVVLYVVISFFHEPWFDEAQAWQIARCASYREIIFVLPHYEGHPALWHLILSVPAKIGLPYELSIKTIGLIITTVSTFLLIKKAPFPKWARALIPFSYFFFYQYGIIVRPYSLVILFLILAAIYFKDKDIRPGRFVLCLIGLCASSAFGIVIAGGIACAWVCDILSESIRKRKFKGIYKDRRIVFLSILLVVAILIVIHIMPANDAYATTHYTVQNILQTFIIAIFGIIPDVFLTENIWSSCEVNLHFVNVDIQTMVLTCILGAFIWGIIVLFSGKKALKYILIPYMFFASFASLVYCYSHHLGVIVFLLIFWVWINIENYDYLNNWNRLKSVLGVKGFILRIKDADIRKLKLFTKIISIVFLGVSVYWAISTSALDIKYTYSYGRDLARFLNANNLANLNIVSEWQDDNVNYMKIPVNVLPYIDDDQQYTVIDNLINPYIMHKKTSSEENDALIQKWSDLEIPDILLGYPDIVSIYGGEVKRTDYSPVYRLDMYFCWKGATYDAYNYVFMRNDLIEKYNLTSLYVEND